MGEFVQRQSISLLSSLVAGWIWILSGCGLEQPLDPQSLGLAQVETHVERTALSGSTESLPQGSWSAIGGLRWGREAVTATLLPSGKVLVIAEFASWARQGQAEVYDPSSGLSLPTGVMVDLRSFHSATLLPSGKVLVAGGDTASAELYDPETGTWSPTGSMSEARSKHTATLLPSGQVLVVGGYSTGRTALTSAELYDPATGTWSAAASTSMSHHSHTATLLPSGLVLVAGGDSAVTELYDPTTDTWALTGSLGASRSQHAATLLPSGQVVVMGGSVNGSDASTSVEKYDPATGTWALTGDMVAFHTHVSAVLLPSGRVLVAGGGSDVAELYDPATETWAATASLRTFRERNVQVLLPSGKVVLLGDAFDYSSEPMEGVAYVEVFDPATETWASPGFWGRSRTLHTLTLLPSGKVLSAGGRVPRWMSPGLVTADLYDPVTNSWSATGNMLEDRWMHTATVLPSGKVLAVGGVRTTEDSGVYHFDSLDTAELYDPATGSWSPARSLGTARGGHTATLLPSGKVLVVGGAASGLSALTSAELYDPATDTWSSAAAPLAAHDEHTATLLPSGKVLVVGGADASSGAELYDPATDTWSWTAAPAHPRWGHTATLLLSGKVLVAGGSDTSHAAELYDPATGTWSLTGSLRYTRTSHTATLLPSGHVLVVGGVPTVWYQREVLVMADLYDPDTGTWSAAKETQSERGGHRATLLPSGQVLVVGSDTPGYATGILYTP
ncbi:kelch-like protein [Archangium minus]|uniref:Kelch-like protein n=1 Tax=Archangium minus TaxID=83450 RepID=A0ABY9X3E3_9BACT|nr:kelch-like protein [Archangium minus]